MELGQEQIFSKLNCDTEIRNFSTFFKNKKYPMRKMRPGKTE